MIASRKFARARVGLLFGFMALFSGAQIGGAADVAVGFVTLSWTLPTSNEDGTPLMDLAGVKLYYGTSSFEYSHVLDVGLTNSFKVQGLIPGAAYYFNGTAYNSLGTESDFSVEALKIAVTSAVPSAPKAPTAVRVVGRD